MTSMPLRLTFSLSERNASILERLLGAEYVSAEEIENVTSSGNARLWAHRLRQSLEKQDVLLNYTRNVGWWLDHATKHRVRDMVFEKTGERLETNIPGKAGFL